MPSSVRRSSSSKETRNDERDSSSSATARRPRKSRSDTRLDAFTSIAADEPTRKSTSSPLCVRQ